MPSGCGRMILVSDLNHFLLRPCLSAKFSSVLTEMPMAGRGARTWMYRCSSETKRGEYLNKGG